MGGGGFSTRRSRYYRSDEGCRIDTGPKEQIIGVRTFSGKLPAKKLEERSGRRRRRRRSRRAAKYLIGLHGT
jgi:hypothetical protein